ncbi:glycosyltransferase family 2 protein [Bacteroides sp.]|uniref:glycosyltransferase family 2 protein n=1 Tax=Bacteroides sp. TaxID=29523 RepID=UPI00262672AA|nr:glycosyltransferase family 2 protein [Bacteroides sp.]MDD3037282.1 glycosyltransferase family 2 protein [Bacteroides sp.]
MNVIKGFEYNDCFAQQHSVDSNLIFGHLEYDLEVTIVIPTFRRGNMIREAIDSALQQNYPTEKFGVIVVDNDPQRNCETEKLMTTEYKQYSHICYYKNRENLGLYGNWNRCFELAHSKWVVLLHDDDFLFDNFLLEAMAFLHQNNSCDIAVLKPEMENWLDDGMPFKKRNYRSKLPILSIIPLRPRDYIFLGNYFGSPTGCIFLRKVVLDQGGFNPSVYPSADTMFMLRMAMQYKVLLYCKVLGARRIGQNVSLNIDVIIKCIDSRYSVVAYLLKYFRLRFLFLRRYADYAALDYYNEIRRDLLPSFTYDLSKLNITSLGLFSQMSFRMISKLYRWGKKIEGILGYILYNFK